MHLTLLKFNLTLLLGFYAELPHLRLILSFSSTNHMRRQPFLEALSDLITDVAPCFVLVFFWIHYFRSLFAFLLLTLAGTLILLQFNL